MKKLRKKLYQLMAVILTVSMMLSVFIVTSFTASAAETNSKDAGESYTSGDFEYTILDDGTAEITGYTGEATVLDIPSELDGYDIVKICSRAFSNCTSLNSITISNGVKEISYSAFKNCIGLDSVTIPESMTFIDYSAFENCDSLTNITVDEGNLDYCSIDGVLFDKDVSELICYPKNKSDLSYEIPHSVTSICNEAFYHCGNLISIIIPDNVIKIGSSAFSECENLSSVTIKEGVTTIGHGAFHNCSNLEEITIPDSVREIYAWGDSAFEVGLYSLEYSRVFYGTKWYNNQPDGVVYAGKVAYCYKGEMPENTEIALKPGTVAIADNAFALQKNLISIDIPDGVTTIGGSAFTSCEKLNDISLPDSVTKIRKNAQTMGYAFKGTGWYENQPDGLVYIGDILFTYKGENLEDTDLVIKNGIKTIADGAFYFCDNFFNIKSVTIPASVKTIGDYAIVNPETIVYGYAGTAAETYANENELTFISLGIAVVTGDANGDGEINAKDRMLLTRYLAKWNGYENIDTTAADVNNDGDVNAKDRMIFTRHLAKWQGYETLPLK